MNIVFVSMEYITEKNFDGGISNYLYKLTKLLLAAGHRPIIVTLSYYENSFFWHEGIEIYRVKCCKHSILGKLRLNQLDSLRVSLINSFNLNRVVDKIYKEYDVDVIQYHSYGLIGVFMKYPERSIVMCASYDPALREACLIKKNIHSVLYDFLMKIILKKAKAGFAPSYFVANKIASDIQTPVAVIRTPLECSTELDYSIYSEWLKGKKYFLFFGTLGTLKGVDLIAEALHTLLERYSNMYFVFVGRVFENANFKLDDIFEKAKEHKSRVIYLGRLEKKMLKPVIKNAHLIVLPSRVDNLPNTLLESLSMNKLVVGPNGASFDEVIMDGETGFLFKEYTNTSLLKAIFDAMDFLDTETDAASRIVKNEEYLQSLNDQEIIRSMVSLYREVAG